MNKSEAVEYIRSMVQFAYDGQNPHSTNIAELYNATKFQDAIDSGALNNADIEGLLLLSDYPNISEAKQKDLLKRVLLAHPVLTPKIPMKRWEQALTMPKFDIHGKYVGPLADPKTFPTAQWIAWAWGSEKDATIGLEALRRAGLLTEENESFKNMDHMVDKVIAKRGSISIVESPKKRDTNMAQLKAETLKWLERRNKELEKMEENAHMSVTAKMARYAHAPTPESKSVVAEDIRETLCKHIHKTGKAIKMDDDEKTVLKHVLSARNTQSE